MRKYFKKYLAFFLACNILVANTGFVLVKHTCNFRKKTTIVVNSKPNSIRNCCKKFQKTHFQNQNNQTKNQNQASFSSSECCTLTAQHLKNDGNLKFLKIQVPVFEAILTILNWHYVAQNVVTFYPILVFYFPNPPPLQNYGTALLIKNCIFRN
jgi:hypothetical protein